MKDSANGGGAGNVVWEDNERVFSRDDAEAVAFADTAVVDSSARTGRGRQTTTHLSKMWFWASAACLLAHCLSAELSDGPDQKRHTTEASRSSMNEPGVRSVNYSDTVVSSHPRVTQEVRYARSSRSRGKSPSTSS